MANELVGKSKGTVLICGSAPSLPRHYAAAQAARPQAKIIAINDAASQVHADYLATLHTEAAHTFLSKSLNPAAPVISGQAQNDTHKVDYWFHACNSGATSAGMAIRVAKAMGFDEIILCGCDMSGGDGYFNAPPKPNKTMMSVRFGNAGPTSGVVRAHQNSLRDEAGWNDYSMVRSMGGFTADLLGYPDFVKEKK